MDAKSKVDDTPRSMDEIIRELEGNSFIGRQEELDFFKQCISLSDRFKKVLHIHGTGGVGKSFLLGEFERFTEKQGALFLKMDSGDFSHKPDGFAEQLLNVLQEKTEDVVRPDDANPVLYRYCLQKLEEVAMERQIVIAVDTYENMTSIDRWFRQFFVRNLHANIFVVLAGRKALAGEWESSPAWKQLTTQIELTHFDYQQTCMYLNRAEIKDEQAIQGFWQFTEGHPLTLSLATLTNQELKMYDPEDFAKEIPQILIKLTEIWLKEVVDQELLEIIEVAALFNRFDQSGLEAILNTEVSTEKFNRLISLSFIKRTKSGWAMHDLVRDGVKIELQYRNPDYLQSVTERLVLFYYKRTVATRSPHNISQFFYHLGDEAIQSAFFQERIDQSMYLEPIDDYNFDEAKAFFDHKREVTAGTDTEFMDRATNTSVIFSVSEEHNHRENSLIDESYIKKMGYECARLLKNAAGETLGIFIVVPINNKTLEHLKNEPVSRAYFSSLSESESAYFNAPEEEMAGFFIRMLDFTSLADAQARSFMLYNLFYLLLSGGKIVVSNPLPFFIDLLGRFGFSEVPGLVHYDYGEDYPTPTHLLDVSGANLAVYLKNFTQDTSKDNQIEFLTEALDLTNRETDIIQLILTDKSNVEIAEELFIAEVTVKKHVTNILKKADVKNRTQLIRRIMELI